MNRMDRPAEGGKYTQYFCNLKVQFFFYETYKIFNLLAAFHMRIHLSYDINSIVKMLGGSIFSEMCTSLFVIRL